MTLTDRERAILEQAFAHRTKWGALGKDQVIQAALDRKNSLEADFTKLWGKVYADAGWTLPEVPAELQTLAALAPAAPAPTLRLDGGFTRATLRQALAQRSRQREQQNSQCTQKGFHTAYDNRFRRKFIESGCCGQLPRAPA